MVEISNKITNGDFDVELKTLESNDEIGILAQNFAKMINTFQNY